MIKITKLIKKNTTKDDCDYYNWGGTDKYTSYPTSYGARCEKYNDFFYRNEDNILEPNCYSCDNYKMYEPVTKSNKEYKPSRAKDTPNLMKLANDMVFVNNKLDQEDTKKKYISRKLHSHLDKKYFNKIAGLIQESYYPIEQVWYGNTHQSQVCAYESLVQFRKLNGLVKKLLEYKKVKYK